MRVHLHHTSKSVEKGFTPTIVGKCVPVIFLGFLVGAFGGLDSIIGLCWGLLLLDVVIFVLAIIQAHSNEVMLMLDTAGGAIFALLCASTFLFFLGTICSILE